MLFTRKFFTMLALAAMVQFGLVGCGGSEEHDHAEESGAHTEDDGHDHGHDDGHGDPAATYEISVAGRTITVEMFGELVAGASVHSDVEVDGDPADAIRVWIGTETGDSMKSRTAGSGGHVDIEVPAELTDEDQLWVEVQAGEEKSTGSAGL